MSREKLIMQLGEYIPYNAQEKADRRWMLHLLETDQMLFFRENLTAHMTASAWVVNQNRTKVLMAYHNIYDSWSWLGGHADGDEDLLHVAVKEVKEESGLQSVHPLSEDIASLEILTVDGHEKRGIYVPSHLHLNVTFFLEADDTEPVKAREGENRAVAWFEPDQAAAASSEPWFRERIYSKLNEKLAMLLRCHSCAAGQAAKGGL